MSQMFYNAKKFNQDIGSWNVKNVTTMENIFKDSNLSTRNYDALLIGWKPKELQNNVLFNAGNTKLCSNDAQNAKSYIKNTYNWQILDGGLCDEAIAYQAIKEDIDGNADGTPATADEINSIDGVNGARNGVDYSTGFVHGEYNNRDNPTSIEIQRVVDNVNLLVDIGIDANDGNATTTNATAQQYNLLSNVDGADSEYETKYQAYIDTHPDAFSSPATETEIQAMISRVNAFVTVWKTDNNGTTSDTTINIPTKGEEYNYSIDCNDDGTYEAIGQTGDYNCSYSGAGTYTVRIVGNFPRIYFNDKNDKHKIISIEQWGTNKWSSMGNAFYGCDNLVINADDTPDLSKVTNMYSMFEDATSFNSPIQSWDVSNVVDMSSMFAGATSFNQDLSNWDVSNVEDMESMFENATDFNEALNWDVSNVRDMDSLFNRASSFNSDITGWNVQNVEDMFRMFRDATSFNQNLENWDVSNVEDMFGMFDGITLSVSNYNSLLNGWNRLSLQTNVEFDAGNSKYSTDGNDSRNHIKSTYNWTITDGGAE